MTASVRYLVVVEGGEGAYSAWLPDVPGCVAAAETREQLTSEMHAALELHFAGMREDGEEPPAPSSTGDYVEIAA